MINSLIYHLGIDLQDPQAATDKFALLQAHLSFITSISFAPGCNS